MNFRRGMARIGWSLLALWGLLMLTVVFRMYHDRDIASRPVCYDASCMPHDENWVLLLMMIVTPLFVWLCWRVLLWIVAGFMPDRVSTGR
jgi:hypothetical protein